MRRILFAVGALTLVAACDLFKGPAVQLEAALTTTPQSEPEEFAKRLSATLLAQLAVPGLKKENLRVHFDKERNAIFFQMLGNEPLPQATLDQVAAKLKALMAQRHWNATLAFGEGPLVEKLVKTEQRVFPLQLSWATGDVRAYVEGLPAYAQMLPADLRAKLPRRAHCILSFTPNGAVPDVQVKPDAAETAAMSEPERAQAKMMALMQGQANQQAPHTLTHAEPLLRAAFKEELALKNEKLLIAYSVIEDANVFDLGQGTGRDGVIMDMGGNVKDACEQNLKKIPAAAAVSARIEQAQAIADIQAIGPVKLIPLVKSK